MFSATIKIWIWHKKRKNVTEKKLKLKKNTGIFRVTDMKAGGGFLLPLKNNLILKFSFLKMFRIEKEEVSRGYIWFSIFSKKVIDLDERQSIEIQVNWFLWLTFLNHVRFLKFRHFFAPIFKKFIQASFSWF